MQSSYRDGFDGKTIEQFEEIWKLHQNQGKRSMPKQRGGSGRKSIDFTLIISANSAFGCRVWSSLSLMLGYESL